MVFTPEQNFLNWDAQADTPSETGKVPIRIENLHLMEFTVSPQRTPLWEP